jgi:hypothetical protein
MSEETRKNMGKTIAEKLEVIGEVGQNERSKSEIAQAYGITLSTVSTYFINQYFIEWQALQGRDMSKHMRIRGAKHGSMEGKLFEWFCHARKNRLAVDGQTVKGTADEIALKMGINFKCSNGWLQRFTDRHNITWHTVSGKGASTDLDSADK